MPKKNSKRGNQRRGSGIAEKGSLPLSENVSADHQLDAVSETGIDSLKPQSPSWDQALRSGFLGNAGLIHPRAIELQVNPFSPAALPNRYSIVFDMRNNFSTVLGVVGPPDDLDIADKLKIEKSLISKVDVTPEGFAVLVLTSHREDKFLLIQNENNQTLCLRNSSDVIRRDIIKYLYNQDDSSLAEEERFCFYVNNNRIHSPDHSFFSTLPNLSKVKVVRVRSHILIVTHHCEPFYEKRYIVRCKNIDSLSNIREQFLRLFLSKEKIFQQLNENDIWFSFNHMILTESLLQQVFGVGFNTLDLAQRLLFQPPGSALQINLAVHFQPTDAISVPVYWKPESGANVRIPKCLLVSPSLISAQELRQEVAKLLHYEPTAFNLELTNKKKLNDKTDLLQVLSTPNCGITVKPKSLITIRVLVVPKPPDTNIKNKFSVHLYRNDYVYKLKSEVCNALSIPLHYVDLHSEGKVLLENKTIGENHLQDNDIVSAIVHKHRVFIIVRALNRKWYHVVVDDCFETTVKDVKLFAVGLDDSDRLLHDCEVLLIYQHRVLPDEHTLGEVGIQRLNNVKLILVHSGSENFTLSSSCNGRLIIFQDTGDGRFQLVIAMSDGRSLYYTPEKTHVLEKVKALVEERRTTSKRIVSFVKGIRKYMIFSENPCHQKEQSLQADQSNPSSHQYCCFQNLPKIVPTWPVTLRQIGDIDINQDNPNGSVQRYNDSLQGKYNNDCTQRKCIQNEPVQKESTHSETIQRGEQQQQHAQSEELQENLSRIQESDLACNSTKSKTIVSSPESKEGNILNSQVTNESDNLNSCRKKLAFDETKVCKWWEQDNDGNTFYREKLDRVVPIENAHKAMSTSSFDSWSSSLVQKFPGTMMIYHPDPSHFQYWGPGTIMPYHLHDAEPEYKYIKKRIIMQIANNLGDEGNQVIRYLGISDSIIHQAMHAFSNNISEKYMYCLRSWCQKCGNQANKEVLKEALMKFNRVDLVNLVDDIDKEDDIIP